MTPLSNSNPIGVFDSGIGGLAIAACINRHLPLENIIYVADHLHFPYGNKDQDFIYKRTHVITEHLLSKGVKAIVVACNTATTHTIVQLRQSFTCPIIGIEPGLKPASEQSKNGKVGVMATSQTLNSPSFKHLLNRFCDQTEFFCQPCPGLAQSIEEHGVDHPHTRALLQQFLEPLLNNNIDTLVLGCTHYAHLIALIRTLIDTPIQIIEPSLAVTKQVQRKLEEQQLLSSFKSTTPDIFSSNAVNINYQTLIPKLWKEHLHFESF